MRLLVWDVSDLDHPLLVQEYFHPSTATDHRHYIIGTTMYLSAYQAGLRIFNVQDPLDPQEIAFVDPILGGGDPPGFGGSWGNFPFFSSGTIVVSSEMDGLFVLKRSH